MLNCDSKRPMFGRISISLMLLAGLAAGCAKLMAPAPESALGRSNAQMREEIKGRVAQAQVLPPTQYEVSLIAQPRMGNPTPTPKMVVREISKQIRQGRSRIINAPEPFSGAMESTSRPAPKLSGEGQALPILTETPQEKKPTDELPFRAGGDIGPSTGTGVAAQPPAQPQAGRVAPTPPSRMRMNPDGSFVAVTPVPTIAPEANPMTPMVTPATTPVVTPMVQTETRY